MANGREWELACGAVDGELSPQLAAEFRAMVADSAAAREVYASLQSQSRRLGSLPTVAAPAGVFDAVMNGVAAAPVYGVPIVIAPAPRRRGRSLVGRVALAAGAFLAVGLGVLNWHAPQRVAVNQAKPHKPDGFNPAPRRAAHPQPAAAPPRMVEVAPAPAPASVEVAERAPDPRPLQLPAVEGGVSFATGPRFALLVPHAPLLAAASELDSPTVAARLRDLVTRDAVVRADLFARDPAAALAALRAALTIAGTELFADPALFESGKAAGGWALYAERLGDADRARLFGALAEAARAGKTGGATLHLFAATPADARDFRELTGVDRGFWKRPRPATAASATADEVADNLRTRHKSALAVPLIPGPRAAAVLGAEAKAFWSKAPADAGGAILIVCRGN